MGNLDKSAKARADYNELQRKMISSMEPLVISKITTSGYHPEEVISAYMLQQITADDHIEMQVKASYVSIHSGRTLPSFVYLEFSKEGDRIVDTVIAP